MSTLTLSQTMIPAASKLIARFRAWADALDSKIQYLGRPMTENPTPKRNHQYQMRLHDCRNMERLQKALRALADAHERNLVPPVLAELKTKDEIGLMVRKTLTGEGGYYAAIEADDYHDTSEPARQLQYMIEGSSHEHAERERLRKIGALEAEIALSNIPGYFPTQLPVVEIMLNRAHIENGMKILEPEAGSGHIADVIRARYPDVLIDTIEISSRLRELLTLKNYRVMAWDFLEFENDQEPAYDRIVMNPPFEHQQDIDHIRKAYSLLASGGILVSVLWPGFEYLKDRKSTEFRAWLQEVGGTWESLPEGAFKASGTGVSTRLLVIER